MDFYFLVLGPNGPSSVPRLNTGTKWSLLVWRDRARFGRGGIACTILIINNSIIDHGPYQANHTQIHRRQGPTQTARHEGSSQVCPGLDEDDTRIDKTTMSNVTTRTMTTRTGTQQRGCKDEDDTRIDETTMSNVTTRTGTQQLGCEDEDRRDDDDKRDNEDNEKRDRDPPPSLI